MEPIIHDGTPDRDFQPPSGFSTGLDLSAKTNQGYAGVADRFPSELLVPRTDWQARIKEMEETQSRTSDMAIAAGLACLDQNGTNYCWGNGPVYCVETVRVTMNQPLVYLSPASVCGPIKNYRNEGGWGKEALEYIILHGIVPVEQWPANARSSQYYTEDNKRLAMKFRVTEWFELQPRNLDELISCLLMRIPVAVGYNWWSHEVTACDPVWLDGTVAIRIRNSWAMSWGDKGFGILQGSKMLPDDAVAPRVAIAS